VERERHLLQEKRQQLAQRLQDDEMREEARRQQERETLELQLEEERQRQARAAEELHNELSLERERQRLHLERLQLEAESLAALHPQHVQQQQQQQQSRRPSPSHASSTQPPTNPYVKYDHSRLPVDLIATLATPVEGVAPTATERRDAGTDQTTVVIAATPHPRLEHPVVVLRQAPARLTVGAIAATAANAALLRTSSASAPGTPSRAGTPNRRVSIQASLPATPRGAAPRSSEGAPLYATGDVMHGGVTITTQGATVSDEAEVTGGMGADSGGGVVVVPVMAANPGATGHGGRQQRGLPTHPPNRHATPASLSTPGTPVVRSNSRGVAGGQATYSRSPSTGTTRSGATINTARRGSPTVSGVPWTPAGGKRAMPTAEDRLRADAVRVAHQTAYGSYGWLRGYTKAVLIPEGVPAVAAPTVEHRLQ
jgi:hypothetical protein